MRGRQRNVTPQTFDPGRYVVMEYNSVHLLMVLLFNDGPDVASGSRKY